MKLYLKMTLICILSFPCLAAEEQESADFHFYNSSEQTTKFKHMLTNTGILVDDNNITMKTILEEKILSIFYKNSADRQICEDLPFIKDIALGRCSGVLIKPDVVVTAGHCVDAAITEQTWFFNYQQDEDLALKTGYKVKSVIFHNFNMIKSNYSFKRSTINKQREKIGMPPLPADIYDYSEYRDLALLKLNKPVDGYMPLNINYDPFLKGRTAVSVGHPLGLSLKFNHNGFLKKMGNPYYMTTNIGTLKGNSGGPLFDLETGDLIGITVNQGFNVTFGIKPGRRCYGFKNQLSTAEDIKHLSGHMTLVQVKPFINSADK